MEVQVINLQAINKFVLAYFEGTQCVCGRPKGPSTWHCLECYRDIASRIVGRPLRHPGLAEETQEV